MTDGRVGHGEVRPVVVLVVVHVGPVDVDAVLSDMSLLARPWVSLSGALPASQSRTGKHGAQSRWVFDGWVGAIRFRTEAS